MTDNSESDKLADLTHHFHEKYRASGIALCISLATVASAEGLWFYNLFKDIISKCNNLQYLLCLITIISAIVLFISSFIYQFIHYHGTKHIARAFFYAYKFSERGDGDSNRNKEKEWIYSQTYFKIADWIIVWMITAPAIVNFIAAIFYVVLYQPNTISIK